MNHITMEKNRTRIRSPYKMQVEMLIEAIASMEGLQIVENVT